MTKESAETVAIQALSFIAQEPERIGRFLALSGIGPESLRDAAREPRFLAGVLDYVAGDERLLLAFAEENSLAPEQIPRARDLLAPPGKGRD
jgi:hypothetical protein